MSVFNNIPHHTLQVPGFTPRYKENTGSPAGDGASRYYNRQDALIQMTRNQQDEQKAPGIFTRVGRQVSDANRYAERNRRAEEIFDSITARTQDIFEPSAEPADTGIYKPRWFGPKPTQLPPSE